MYTKSRLIYLWFQNYRCFKNSSISFCDKYLINFDFDNKILSINKNDKYVDNFFGENIDIHAIVGKNGAGKTSALERIMKCASGDRYLGQAFDESDQFIYIFEIIVDGKKEIRIIVSRSLDIDVENNSKIPEQLLKDSYEYSATKQGYNFLDETVFVYCSDSFNNNIFPVEFYNQKLYCPYAEINQIELKNKNKNKYSKISAVQQYFCDRFKKQIEFLCANSKILENYRINVPNQIRVRFKPKSLDEGIRKKENLSKEINELKNKLLNILPKDASQNVVYNIFSHLDFENLYRSINRYESMNNLNENYDKNKWGFLKFFIKMGYLDLEPGDKEFITYLAYNISDSEMFYKFDNDTLVISTKNEKGNFNFRTISHFLELYKRTIVFQDMIDFQWDISSGESALLSSLANVYRLKDYLRNERASNVVLLLDEAEISLHPDWQRSYVNSLIELTKTKYFKNVYFDIIFATHSPFILPDIPNQNVAYLNKKENRTIGENQENHAQTFCANIYDLFNDSFYMDSFTGEFAKNKINAMLDELNGFLDLYDKKHYIDKNFFDRRPYYLRIINLIGEPLLRNNLKHMIRLIEEKTNDSNISKSECEE